MRLSSPSLCLTSTLALSFCLEAQTVPSWTQVSTLGPVGRFSHAMCYDQARGRVVLFGGHDIGRLGDTWEWDGASWTERVVSGPSPRWGHAMAYDPTHQRVLLYGGEVGTNTRSSELWAWDGSSWSLLSSGIGPGPRSTHAMAYDEQQQQLILFGDSSTSDTWRWDGSTWAQAASTGPSARACCLMTYDSIRQRVVLFGGLERGTAAVLGDTWEWDGTAWSQRSAIGPANRHSYGMIFDRVRGQTLMFGGFVGGGLGDTWEWDGQTWTHHPTAGPFARSWHAMAYDTQRHRAVLFGGFGSGNLSDTWERTSPFGATATAYGTGCGSPALVLNPDPAARPILGNTARVSLANAPTPFAFMVLGWSDNLFNGLGLPLSLAGLGMQGCFLLTSAESGALPVTPTGPGTADFVVPFPNIPQLIGLNAYLQGWAVAPGQNPGDAIVSNGVVWGIGNI